MAEALLAKQSERLVSLDAFRGITIAAMVLVNNPGTWNAMYKPLGHAHWDGWTPTDLIFPFFLFMVGVAMTFSFDKRLKSGFSKVRLFEQVVRRTLILFFLGLLLTTYPHIRLMMPWLFGILCLGFLFADEPPLGKPTTKKSKRNKILAIVFGLIAYIWFWNDLYIFISPRPSDSFWWMYDKYVRVPGVLQRIALCYFAASLIMFFTGLRGRMLWFWGLVLGYWIFMAIFDTAVPGSYSTGGTLEGLEVGAPFTGQIGDWIDQVLLGKHLYSMRPDPEGLLSTIPAIASTLGGVLCGMWLKNNKDRFEKVSGMLAVGLLLMFVGICIDYWFPINKKIWSSSYVVFVTGFACISLGLCYWVIDVQGYKKWAKPFEIFGTNAILIFWGSGILMRTAYMFRFPKDADGNIIYSGFSFNNMWEQDGSFANLKDVIYKEIFLDPMTSLFKDADWFAITKNASLGFALFYIALWLLLTYPLYRKKIFLKV